MSSSWLTLLRRAGGLRPVALPPVEGEATTLPPSEVYRGMRLGVAEGIFGQIHLSLTVGTLATGLALLFGAQSFALGLLAAMPVIGALMQLPAAWWIERSGKRRRLAVLGSLGRQLWLVPAVLLFVPVTRDLKLQLLLLATALGNILFAVAAIAWTGWMTDLIPPRVRGRYFGTRGALTGAAAMIAGWGGAWLVDQGRARGQEAAVYGALLVVAAVCGAIASLILARQPEPSMTSHPRRSLRELLVLPVHNRPFRAFSGTFVIWQIGLGVAAPFFIAYALTTLQLPLRTLALMDAITALTGLVAQPRWGTLADRIGQRRVLQICMALIVPLPWNWLLATPERIWPLYFNAVVAGITWAGFTMTQANRLMEQAPEDGRSAYFASFSIATGLPYMAASLGAGLLMSMIGVEPVAVAGLTFHPYLALFLLSGILRLASLLIGRKHL